MIRKPKYRNVRTAYDGCTYDSKAEAKRAAELDLLAQSGAIRWWLRQPRFRLGCPENVYVADFLVIGHGGEHWVEDVKGFASSKFKRDCRLWAAYGPCSLHIIKGKSLEVIPGGASAHGVS